jgi:(1->4)-alpha-D-glucan 1-alpha-D-glucosylmutase
VDPDNRRPVDWDRRREALAAVKAGEAPDTPDFRKLKLIVRALEIRKRRPDVFTGSYEPIDAGERAIAYIRGGAVFVAAEILPGGADAAIEVPGRGRTPLADVLDDHGIALEEL